MRYINEINVRAYLPWIYNKIVSYFDIHKITYTSDDKYKITTEIFCPILWFGN